jgi:hypothetical protein
MKLDPTVWGPHYWFFIHTIALSYPLRPNAVTKKKYYDFIQNLPLFLPNEQMATHFEKLLDLYPVTPYLDTRESFIRWTHHIHNKINELLEKKKISLAEFYEQYYDNYKPKEVKFKEYYKIRAKVIYLVIVILFIAAIVYFYNK